MTNAKSFVLSFFCSIVWFGCGEHGVAYNDVREVGLWPEHEVYSFDEIPLNKDQKISLRLFHSDDYGYENIYLKLIAYHKSDTIYNNVVSIDLMNDSGMWAGNQSGKLRSIEYPLNGLSLDENGLLGIEVAQYSRDDFLRGIEKIEVLVRK